MPRRTQWRPQRLYLSLDGSMTPLRDPWKRDGSLGPVPCRYGECKTAVAYETRLDGNGKPVVVRRQYTTTLEGVEIFEQLVAGLAYHCGSDQAIELVVLADGLSYNWLIAKEHFPEALQILDFYHVMGHLHTLARLCLGSDPADARKEGAAAAAWVAIQKEQLLQDGGATVGAAIQALPAPNPEAQECREQTHGYFARNAERMRYRTFVAAGYQIGSGVMEAACKTVAHQRLDQAGMHWRPETADAVVALRANQLSHPPATCDPTAPAGIDPATIKTPTRQRGGLITFRSEHTSALDGASGVRLVEDSANPLPRDRMMLDLFLKLIDRVIDLVKRRQEMNRSFYTDFVAPAFADFEAVHKDYLSRFRQYRELIEKSDQPLDDGHPLFVAIAEDNLFSSDLRAKLYELRSLSQDPFIGPFIQAILLYMFNATVTPLGSPRRYEDPADVEEEPADLEELISRTFDSDFQSVMVDLGEEIRMVWGMSAAGSQSARRQLALNVMDHRLGRLQSNFQRVVHELQALKKSLLLPKWLRR